MLTAMASPRPMAQLEPDGAPNRQTDGPGVPPPISWPAPPLGRGPFELESAEERHLRAVVVARGLEQPWSMAFLPDGNMLITERPGRLRIVRAGRLDPDPVEGVPPVRADGLQGLMDVGTASRVFQEPLGLSHVPQTDRRKRRRRDVGAWRLGWHGARRRA